MKWVAGRVRIGHHVGHGREIDLQRIDVVVLQADLDCQPFGQPFQGHDPMRRRLGFPLLVGDHHQRVMLGSVQAPVGDQLVGVAARHQPVGNQRFQDFGQCQPVLDNGGCDGLEGGKVGHRRHYSHPHRRGQAARPNGVVPAVDRLRPRGAAS